MAAFNGTAHTSLETQMVLRGQLPSVVRRSHPRMFKLARVGALPLSSAEVLFESLDMTKFEATTRQSHTLRMDGP
jgi:hypothetical protein